MSNALKHVVAATIALSLLSSNARAKDRADPQDFIQRQIEHKAQLDGYHANLHYLKVLRQISEVEGDKILRLYIFGGLITVPDYKTHCAVERMEKREPSADCGPASSHLFGYGVRKGTQKPFVGLALEEEEGGRGTIQMTLKTPDQVHADDDEHWQEAMDGMHYR